MHYILKNCTDDSVLNLKSYLKERNVSDDYVAQCSAIFYEPSSTIVHNVTGNITLDEIELALKALGISQENIIIAKAIYALQKGSALK